MPVKISQILRDNGIRKLYHFTDRANLQSIIQHGGLYSWEDCAIKGIVIPRSGSNELSRSLDRQHGLQDYVRLSFTRNHPMMHAAMREGRISDPVILEIDVTVADKENTLFADRNATRNGAKVGAGESFFNNINIPVVTQKAIYDLSDAEREFYQAEVLVKNKIPLESILNIADFAIPLPSSQEAVSMDNKSGVQRDIPFCYDEVRDFSEGLAGVKKGNKWGYIDKNGNEIIPCVYDYIRNFSEGLAPVFSGDIVEEEPTELDNVHFVGEWGFVETNGNQIIDCTYDYVGNFSNGLARVEKNGKWGYIDKNGNQVIPCIYEIALDFSEGLAAVTLSHYFSRPRKWEVVDKDGSCVITHEFDSVGCFSNGLARVEKNGKWGYIDKNGNEVVPCICDCVCEFSEGLAAIKTNGIWNFIDNTGTVLIADVSRDNCDRLEPVSDFSDGLSRIASDDGWKFIDKSGTEVIHINKFKYDKDSQECDEGNVVDYVGDFHEGLAKITQYPFYYDHFYYEEYKSGFIDKTGIMVIPCIYDYIYNFSDGLALVEKVGKYGFINRAGTEVISCVYDEARDFSEGFAAVAVYVNGILKWGFIDKNGRAIIPPNLSEQISDGDPDDDLPF